MIEEDGMDMRPYLRTLIRRWKLVLGLTLGAAAAAAAISMIMPPTYEADSMVAVAALGAKPVPELKSYLDLATSDGLLAELAKSPSAATGGSAPTPDDLRRHLKATPGSDPSLINLKVTDSSPQRSTDLARNWNDLFVRSALSIFNPAEDNYEQLQAQLASARKEYQLAEEKLAAIESRTRLRVVQSELTSQRAILAALFASKANLQNAGESSRSMRERLRQLPPSAQADAADDAAIILIQSSILAASVQSQLPPDSHTTVTGEQIILPSTPLQLQTFQLQVPQQADRTVASQLASLEGISALVRDRTAGADKQIEELRASVTELDTRVTGILIEQGELLAQRDALRFYFRELEAKTSAAKAIFESGTAKPRIILEARPDSEPQPRGTARNALVAALLGLVIAAAAVFGIEHFQSKRQTGETRPEIVATT